MSDENNSKKKSNVLADKGFYIVLFVCVAIIGIASWALLFTESGLIGAEPAVSTANGKTENPPKNETTQPEQKNTTNDLSDDKADETMGGVPVGAWEDDFITNDPADGEQSNVGTSTDPTNPEPTESDDDKEEENALNTARFVWPLSGTIEVAYSMDDLVYDKTMADWRTHNGIDIEAQIGTKVMAVLDGTVKSVYTDDMYGTTVVISHGGGLESVYSNLAGMPTVKEGDTVTSGMVIGSVGNTAAAETNEVSHLHFAMMLDGVSVDPTDYLPSR